MKMSGKILERSVVIKPQGMLKEAKTSSKTSNQRFKEIFHKNKESRGKLIMPCATGKSLTAFWIAES